MLWPDLTPLRTVPGLRLLFASRTITAFGAQATEVAVLVQARQLTRSPLVRRPAQVGLDAYHAGIVLGAL